MLFDYIECPYCDGAKIFDTGEKCDMCFGRGEVEYEGEIERVDKS